jgi:predicted aminopeptidase
MKKKILLVFSLFLLVLFFTNHKIIFYGIEQLRGQLNIVFNTKEIDEVLNDSSVPDSIKQKLLLIQEIKKFAVDSIGLKPTNNYSTYYDQQGKPVLWVLTASPPFQMKSYEWHYPFLGNLSYKGFFEKEKGEKEKQLLDVKNYDTDLSTVGGWSTLGWFRDPVLSKMLRKSDGALAELIIHELTHATVYIKGNVEYNENLATFVGEKGAEKFLTCKYPNDQSKINEYKTRMHDEEVFGNYIVNCIDTLEKLYSEIRTSNNSSGKKYLLKYRKIASLVLGIKNLPLQQMTKYEWNFKTTPLPNNTYFLSYSNYRKRLNSFETVFSDSCKGNLSAFVAREAENN